MARKIDEILYSSVSVSDPGNEFCLSISGGHLDRAGSSNSMSDWLERKNARRKHYKENVEGWHLVTCTACSGSGYYDNNGSPKCWCCGGTGKMRVPPDKKEVK